MLPPSAIRLPLGYSTLMTSFFRGQPSDIYLDEAKNELWYRFKLSSEAAGPPGLAHGGFCAAILDEAMGAAVWLQGIKALAGKLEFRYRNPVPLRRVLYVRAGIIRRSGSRARARADMFLDEKTVLVSGEGLFVSSPFWNQQEISQGWDLLLKLHELREDGMNAQEALRQISAAKSEFSPDLP